MSRRTILSRAPWGALIAVGLVAGCGSSGGHRASTDAAAATPTGSGRSTAPASVTPAPARTVAGAGARAAGKRAAKRTRDSHPTAGPDVVTRSAGRTPSSSGTSETKGTAPSSSQTTPQSPKLPRLFPAAVSHVFSGTGSETLGPASLATGATLRWQSSSELVIRSPGSAAIHLQPPNGTMRIRPGNYEDITVAASGPWTLKLQVAS
jgi:hypothetical protein